MADLVTLSEAKLYLRVDGNAEDNTIALLIAAASDAVRDVEYGEEIQTWTDLATVWAEARQQGGQEYLAAATTLAERRVVFFIRWYPGLTVLDRVSYDGLLHNINEVREIGQRDGIELHTEAAV